ncbi:FliH/SctL family protein [Dethiosulfovibrio salsuginis]|uniref:Flagellar assembly protein FliH n=1 Tax=Dethiosulfovibrio salsuginis TaxID=561720 RepID=A0A1X7K9D8_9BACT|nr:FliH/SctL family protein [Dethiosulfovibrio salsuginis]SMG37738.1 flagellar assembly protein FliH [Dethiosulfovibrio salsuginis]
MSDLGRQRLIRAARVLTDAVRIGAPPEPSPEELLPEDELQEPSQEDLLRQELDRWKSSCAQLEKQLKDSQSRIGNIEARMEADRDSQKKQMEAFLEQSEKDRQAAVEQGHAEGFAAGKEEGFTLGRSELEAEIRAELEKELSGSVEILNTVHDQIQKDLEQLLAANPYRLIRLWQKVLSRLLVREVAFDQEAALRLFKNLLSRASEKEDIRVYLNPEDLDAIEAQRGNFGELVRGVRNIEFMADDEVDKGSCIVETGLGIYDARWRTQLEQISTEVEAVLTEGKNRE